MSIRTMPFRRTLVALTLVAAGGVAGGLAALATTANADPTTSPTSTPSASSSTGGKPAETPLTGDTLTKVKDAVSAKYPGATFNRVETDSDGVYEAHIATSAGDNITVELDKAYAITGTE